MVGALLRRTMRVLWDAMKKGAFHRPVTGSRLTGTWRETFSRTLRGAGADCGARAPRLAPATGHRVTGPTAGGRVGRGDDGLLPHRVDRAAADASAQGAHVEQGLAERPLAVCGDLLRRHPDTEVGGIESKPHELTMRAPLSAASSW